VKELFLWFFVVICMFFVTPVLKVSRILNTFVKTDTGYIKSYNTESDISRNSDTRVIYYII